MCPYFLAIGFFTVDWWAISMQSNFTSYVQASFGLVLLQLMINFWHGCITCKSGSFYLWKDACKKAHTQFNCVTWCLPVKTGRFTCFYVASSSRRVHAIAFNEARKLQVTSPAGCKLTYLPLGVEFTRGVIADCLQLQVILCKIAGSFACDCAGIFACDSIVFASKLHAFLPAKAGNFEC